MGRYAQYKGVLAVPFPSSDLSDDERMIAFIERLQALADHFGLSPATDGFADLALALARRHEPEFRRNGRLSPILRKYGVDPRTPDPFFALIIKMMMAHVPSFKPVHHDRFAASRFNDLDLATLCLAEFAVRMQRPTSSRRERARILRDEVALTKLIGPDRARDVIRILGHSGNLKAGHAGHEKSLSDKRLRELIAIFEDPGRFFVEHDPIAAQIFANVFPLMVSAASRGQKGSQKIAES